MYVETCIFCKIARGEEKSFKVFENDVAFAFLDKRPLFPGHTLLIPKDHIPTFMDLPEKDLTPFYQSAQLIAKAMEEGLGAEGTFVAMNNRVSQSVPHLHVHIVPRRKKDGLKGFFWPRYAYKSEEEMVEIQKKLTTYLQENFYL